MLQSRAAVFPTAGYLSVVFVSVVLLLPHAACAQAVGVTATQLGLTLQQLSAADLDAIEQAAGHRVGVLVAAVAPGSPAEQAGIKAGDIVFAVAGQGVASPQAVDQALAGAAGQVAMGIVRMAGEEASVLELSVTVAGGAPQQPAGGFAPFGGQTAATPATPATVVPAQPAGTVGGKPGKLVQSPLGMAITIPADWQSKDSAMGIDLVPPDLAANAQGGLEYLVLTSLPAQGITAATDPRVEQVLDALIAQQVPFMQRVSAAQQVQTPVGTGIALAWEGTAQTGVAMRARAFAAIVGGTGVLLAAVGERQAIANRDPVLGAIFATLTATEVQRDGNLVGTWLLLETKELWNQDPNVSSQDRARVVSDDKNWLTVNADGSLVLLVQHEMLAGGAGVWLEDKSEQKTAGQWAAGGGKLHVMWEDGGSSRWQYELYQAEGRIGLRLVDSKQQQTWARQ